MPTAQIPILATNQNVTSTTLAQVMTINVGGMANLVSIGILNTGAAALNGFAIARQFVDGGPFFYYLGGTDFNTATSKLSASAANSGVTPPLSPPQSLPAGNATTQAAWIDFDPGACTVIQLLASVASGTATLTIEGAVRKQTQP